MKTLTILFLSLFLGKGCTKEQKSDLASAVVQYEANTRGFYKKITITNQTIAITKDRDAKDNGEISKISDADWKTLIVLFKAMKLENLPKLKDPTQKRFYDGAAIAKLQVKYQKKEYQTTEFDHGFPPAEIEKMVLKINALAEAKSK